MIANYHMHAHRADLVWNPEGLKKAKQIAAESHLQVLDTADLINTFRPVTRHGEVEETVRFI